MHTSRSAAPRASRPQRRLRGAVTVAALAAVTAVGSCRDDQAPIFAPIAESKPPTLAAVVSNPVVTTAASASAPATARAVTGADVNTGVPRAYVSLPPGAYPDGRSVTISAPGGSRAVTTLVDGGFDPVPIEAGAGDVLVVDIELIGGNTASFTLAVPATRPPIIVRTDPPPRKRDVPLNASLLIVFSEPITAGSTTGAVQLYRGTDSVPGTAALLPGAGVGVTFTPTTLLDPNTDYRLVVTQSVRDLDGDALATAQSVEFTTGIAPTGAAAAIDLSPDTVYMSTSYQMTVTVRDTAGNELFGEPVAWSTSDPVNLEVSQTGLLTAYVSGGYWVRAQLGALQATASVSVSPAGPAASIEIAPLTAFDSVVVGGSTPFYARVRDAAGNDVPGASVTWRSSNTAVAAVAPYDACCGWIAAGVTGVGLGNATITATSGSSSGSVAVTVVPWTGAVAVTPDSVTIGAEESAVLRVVVRNAAGDSLSSDGTCWYHSNSSIARLQYNGSVGPDVCPEGYGGWWDISGFPDRIQVEGIAPGSAVAVAINGGGRDTVFVTVTPRRVPVSLSIVPDTATLAAFSRRLDAVAVDVNGVRVTRRPITWTSSNPAVATVTEDSAAAACAQYMCFARPGMVRAVSPGTAVITATTEGLTASASVTVPSRTLGSISTDRDFQGSCGVTDERRTYCWGFWDTGYWFHREALYVGGVPSLTSVTSGGSQVCGLDPQGAAWCWGIDYLPRQQGSVVWPDSLVAEPVPGGVAFGSLDVGGGHVCGLISSGAAYCWGNNDHGQLGTGGMDFGLHSTPNPVSGGLFFVALSAGDDHACGVTMSGAAYCWGQNDRGQLGDGTTTDRSVPVPVQGGLTFASLAAGYAHTCGLTASGAVWCWGANGSGELGDGSTTGRLTPTAVATGVTFVAISTGGHASSTEWWSVLDDWGYTWASNTCALTSAGEAWCWGENAWGQLGDGSTTNRTVPTLVAGGLRFAAISAGGSHSCGVTPAGDALCWGMEYGTTPVRTFPP